MSRAVFETLNTAMYRLLAPGASAVHATMSPWRYDWWPPLLCWFTCRTSGLVINEMVNASLVGKSPPNISGERNIDHNVIRVCCSSCVKVLGRSSPRSARMPMCHSGTMSAYGQLLRLQYVSHERP